MVKAQILTSINKKVLTSDKYKLSEVNKISFYICLYTFVKNVQKPRSYQVFKNYLGKHLHTLLYAFIRLSGKSPLFERQKYGMSNNMLIIYLNICRKILSIFSFIMEKLLQSSRNKNKAHTRHYLASIDLIDIEFIFQNLILSGLGVEFFVQPLL